MLVTQWNTLCASQDDRKQWKQLFLAFNFLPNKENRVFRVSALASFMFPLNFLFSPSRPLLFLIFPLAHGALVVWRKSEKIEFGKKNWGGRKLLTYKNLSILVITNMLPQNLFGRRGSTAIECLPFQQKPDFVGLQPLSAVMHHIVFSANVSANNN